MPLPALRPILPPRGRLGVIGVVVVVVVVVALPPPSFVPPFPAVSLAVSAGRRRNLKLVVWQTLGGRKE